MTRSDSRSPGHRHMFTQRLAALDKALPHAADDVRTLLSDIRAAAVRVHEALTALHEPTRPWRNGIDAVCFQCGGRNLDVLYTSKQEGYQLCESCFKEWEQRGRARVHETDKGPRTDNSVRNG